MEAATLRGLGSKLLRYRLHRCASRILFGMNTTEILSAINEEISRLTEVRSLLGELDTAVAVPKRLRSDTARRRGRPKGSKNKGSSFNPGESSPPNRRTTSPEWKARIAAAQRARWARQHAEGVTPKAEKRSTAVANARLNPPPKVSSKASPPGKDSTVVDRVATKPTPAKKPNGVKAAPAKSAAPRRTQIAPKKTASQVAAGAQAVKHTAPRRPQPKSSRPRTAPGKTPVPIKAISRTETPPGSTSESPALSG